MRKALPQPDLTLRERCAGRHLRVLRCLACAHELDNFLAGTDDGRLAVASGGTWRRSQRGLRV